MDDLFNFVQLDDKIANAVPQILTIILIVVLAIIFGRLLRFVTKKTLTKFVKSPTIINLFSTFAYIVVLAVGIVAILQILELDKAVASVLAGAGIIGLALGFAFQDVAANFLSGIIIAFQNPFKVGDLVETNETFGTVKRISLRMTQIQTLQGQMVYIPNKEILLNPLIDYSDLGQRRIDLVGGVSYGDDLSKVRDITIKAVKSIEQVDTNKPIDLYYQEFGESSINYVISFWTDFKKQPDFLSAQSEAIMAIKLAYEQEDIMIPFPIRTLDFGIKGGEKLSAELANKTKNK